MSIQAIDSTSVHRLTSGQVVTSLQTALKELVDNALDARASSVEVRLKEHGLASIEVVDNGSGIPKKDYASIALKHHTSKLASFADLTSVRTLGFRGEALSSLCALCDEVEVVTATAEEAPVGTRIRFDKGGNVASDGEKVARPRGTTITLLGLFAPMPVRLADLQKNAKREFAKAITLLQGYALVAHLDGGTGAARPKGKGVRWNVTSTGVKGGKKTVHLKTDGSGSLRAALTSIWGPKSGEGLVEVDFEVELPPSAESEASSSGTRRVCRVHGVISSPAQPARSSADRQFYSINARPFTPSKIQKAVNDAWRSLNPAHTPVVVLNLFIPPDAFDVNVSPDKRTVFFHDENAILEGIRANLLATFGGSSSGGLVSAPSASASTSVPDRLQALKQSKLGVGFRPKPIELELDDELPESDEADADVAQAVRGRERSSDALFSSPPPALPALVTSSPASSSRSPQPGPSLSRATPPVALPDRSIESDSPDPVEAYDPDQDSQSIRPSSPQHRPAAQLLSPVAQGKQRERSVTLAVLKVDMQSLMRGRRGTPTGRQASVAPLDQDEGEDEIADDLPSVLGSAAVGKRPMSVARDTPSDGEEEGEATPLVLHRPPPAAPVQPRSQAASPGSIAPRPRRTRTVRFNPAEIISRHRSARSRPDHPLTSGAIAGDGSAVISGDRASITAPAEIAERELSRTIVKADFATMEPLGQFNMGFIIARKRTAATADRTGGDDLFIIDQHASDEKFNFETLQNETRILSQGLIQPRVLELSAVDVELVQDNMDVLKKNGFEVGIQEAPGAEDDEAGRTIVTLRAQPVSKETVFDFSDLEELLHLMKDQPSGQMVRCSKARAMFAMRACRKSVMVGRPLTKPQMTKVVRNMGLIDQPWNCPHGRPTMRHLTSLADLAGQRASDGPLWRRPIDWPAVIDT